MKSVKRASLLMGIFLLLAGATFAAGVDGKWMGDINTPDGQTISLTMNFKVDGDKVTGTITGPQGDIPITEGKMDGDTLEFTLSVDAAGLVFKCSGKLAGDDQLNLTMNGGSAETSFTVAAKRSA